MIGLQLVQQLAFQRSDWLARFYPGLGCFFFAEKRAQVALIVSNCWRDEKSQTLTKCFGGLTLENKTAKRKFLGEGCLCIASAVLTESQLFISRYSFRTRQHYTEDSSTISAKISEHSGRNASRACSGADGRCYRAGSWLTAVHNFAEY